MYAIGNLSDQIWLLSRRREDFKVEMRGRIHETLRRLGLDPERLVLSKNKGCVDDDDGHDEVENGVSQLPDENSGLANNATVWYQRCKILLLGFVIFGDQLLDCCPFFEYYVVPIAV